MLNPSLLNHCYCNKVEWLHDYCMINEAHQTPLLQCIIINYTLRLKLNSGLIFLTWVDSLIIINYYSYDFLDLTVHNIQQHSHHFLSDQ